MGSASLVKETEICKLKLCSKLNGEEKDKNRYEIIACEMGHSKADIALTRLSL